MLVHTSYKWCRETAFSFESLTSIKKILFIIEFCINHLVNKKQAVAYKYIRYLLYPMHKLNATACTSII